MLLHLERHGLLVPPDATGLSGWTWWTEQSWNKPNDHWFIFHYIPLYSIIFHYNSIVEYTSIFNHWFIFHWYATYLSTYPCISIFKTYHFYSSELFNTSHLWRLKATDPLPQPPPTGRARSPDPSATFAARQTAPARLALRLAFMILNNSAIQYIQYIYIYI